MTSHFSYLTRGGIRVDRRQLLLVYAGALDEIRGRISTQRGALFASGYEAPGRYNRWDIGFVTPPLEFRGRGRAFTLQALNPRGVALVDILADAVRGNTHVEELRAEPGVLRGLVAPMEAEFPEENRTRQSSLISVLRCLLETLHSPEDSHAGLYGAFGYDLVHQLEPIRLFHARADDARDLHLYLPDDLVVVDHQRQVAERFQYDFTLGRTTTRDLAGGGESRIAEAGAETVLGCDHAPGEYAATVEKVRTGCKAGDFFEVVPSQTFTTGYAGTPLELFDAIAAANPSPYEFMIHMGDQQLIGASPEMYVRVEGKVVETCPISGTVARGRDALEDAEQIRKLLTSPKEESELTMCTDVDRNDKARVCRPGSVRVIGRRMIETYSRLFHTVDHVTGILRDDCDGLDAFVAHMWACTLTGAPKPAAMQRIEELEKSPREWYGGAVGFLRFDGSINTGITIRTVKLKDGIASLRVGATLLYDSDPVAEEQETRLKAEAILDAATGRKKMRPEGMDIGMRVSPARRILFVDNRDSFVHTLADYVRQTGADVRTLRAGFRLERLDTERPELVFISPGPGRPEDFGVPELVRACVARGIPIFGVCLGLQGMVEAFGGKLGVLDNPMHGKPSLITNAQTGIFEHFPKLFTAGRYHSLYAIPEALPESLEVTARSQEGTIMAVAHRTYPAAAVQFHPESILTLGDRLGHRLIRNVIGGLTGAGAQAV
jgi:anthranilate synthase